MAVTKANGKAAISLRLAAKKVSFPTFMDAVGRTIFGDTWPKSSAKHLELSTEISEGTYEVMVGQVRDDIVAALADGVIKVGFTEIICMGHPQQISAPIAELGDDNFLLDDDPIPSLKIDFTVKMGHWLGDTAKSFDLWSTSDAFIRHDSLSWDLSKGQQDTYRKGSPFAFMANPFRHLLYIKEPIIALENLFKSIDIPDEAWCDRYRSCYRSPMTQELVTAGWRYLAVEKPVDAHGIKAKIADAMIKYLHLQRGTDPYDGMIDGISSINNIADKLHRQWFARDLESPVLLNSARASKSIKAEKKP